MKNTFDRNKLIKIGELAEKARLHISKIRYYTNLGLLNASAFTDGGQFLFDEENSLDEIKYINELSKMGMSLKEICEKENNKYGVKKIAIIDDDKEICKMVFDILKNKYSDCMIKISTDVFDAGHMLTEYLPDLVFLDVHLPAVKGFEICSFIKTNIALKNTKVIAMSSFDTKETRERMLANGAEYFMSKPIDIDKFIVDLIKIMKK